MPIDLLDSKTRSINLTNAAGVAADADSTPTYVITLPDGTAIHVVDNKSRDGVLASWSKTPDGYAVLLSSQHSGADVEAVRLAGKVVDKVQIIPVPLP